MDCGCDVEKGWFGETNVMINSCVQLKAEKGLVTKSWKSLFSHLSLKTNKEANISVPVGSAVATVSPFSLGVRRFKDPSWSLCSCPLSVKCCQISAALLQLCSKTGVYYAVVWDRKKKKLYALRSGCLLIRDASNVSPTATHNGSEYGSFGESGIDASDQFLLWVHFIPKVLVDVTLNFWSSVNLCSCIQITAV